MQSKIIEFEREQVRTAVFSEYTQNLENAPADLRVSDRFLESSVVKDFVASMAFHQFMDDSQLTSDRIDATGEVKYDGNTYSICIYYH